MNIKKTKSSWKNIFLSALGNILEWFDYAIYGAFSTIIAKNFFPQNDVLIAQIYTYAIFAIGFISRPIGGVLFGHIGDLYGRKKILFTSILLMALSTAAIGLIPNYDAVGIFAPILLLLMRTCQGLAIGGEYTGSMVYLVEQAPKNRKGMTGSLSELGCLLGTFVGGQATMMLLSVMISRQSLESWGWRIPFLVGGLVVIYAIYIKNQLKETPIEKPSKKPDLIPVIEAFKHHWGKLLAAFFSTAFTGISFYIVLVFLPNYVFAQTQIKGSDMAFIYSGLTNFAMILSVSFFGYLSDLVGRKPLMYMSIIFIMILCYPMMHLSTAELGWAYATVQVLFGISLAMFYGARSAFFSETFPPQIRMTAVSLVVGCCQAVFGGTTPLIATYITSATGDIKNVAFLLIIICPIALLSTCQHMEAKQS